MLIRVGEIFSFPAHDIDVTFLIPSNSGVTGNGSVPENPLAAFSRKSPIFSLQSVWTICEVNKNDF